MVREASAALLQQAVNRRKQEHNTAVVALKEKAARAETRALEAEAKVLEAEASALEAEAKVLEAEAKVLEAEAGALEAEAKAVEALERSVIAEGAAHANAVIAGVAGVVLVVWTLVVWTM
jgi:uncharacterized protein (DUF3084 family)